MTDLDLDALEVLDDDTDDNYARIRKTDLDGLRGAAKKSGEFRRRAETLEREKAVTDAGLTELTTEQSEALTALVKEPTAEALKAKAVALGFIAAPEPVVSEAQIAEHDAAAAVANGAGAPTSLTLTRTDMAAWSKEKRVQFASTHPELAETVARGGSVTAPAGFAA